MRRVGNLVLPGNKSLCADDEESSRARGPGATGMGQSDFFSKVGGTLWQDMGHESGLVTVFQT